ncbi:MAG: riboflavin biosynthesis protein RibF [Bernardetiaceae bacterium]|nr:riboflavin biosynthesis protein RibF [Bernardetiaceae bacterium]
MQIHYGLAQFPRLAHSVVTEGIFDGVHVGHQRILQRLVQLTAQVRAQTGAGAASVVLTFWPHPRLVLQPQAPPVRLLSTLPEKIEQMAAFGIDQLVVIPFDEAFARQTPAEYVVNVLQKVHTRHLVIGYDHRFGHQRAGDFAYLQAHQAQFGLWVEEIPRQDVDQVGVSSTKIRNALAEGNMVVANQYLGRPYTLAGVVTPGDQIGRTLGYPTANLALDEPLKLVPADGIYAVRVRLAGQIHDGMLYIGNRSTLGQGLQKVIEVNIFDFERQIYGQTLQVEFWQRLRGEIQFAGLEMLKQQMAQDKAQAQIVLAQLAPATNLG